MIDHAELDALLGASGMTGPLVPIGYPAEEPPATERKSVDAVTQWID